MRRAGNSDVAIIRKKNKKDKSDNNEPGIDATALWDPWDVSPSALEIVATKYIWPPPTFATDSVFFRWAACAAYQISRASLLAVFKGEQKRGVDRGTGEIGEWGNSGRWGRVGGGRESTSASTTREVPSSFSAAVAPTVAARSSVKKHNCHKQHCVAISGAARWGGGVKLPPYGWTSKNCVI